MRETLIKRRFGVPALLLIAIVLTAGSIVAYSVVNFNCSTTTDEPLTFTMTNDLNINYQGESDDIVVTVTNSASVGYGIFVDCRLVGGQVDSVSYSDAHQVASEPDEGNLNNDGDLFDAEYNIGPNSTIDIVATIDSADDAGPGDVVVTLDFQRKSAYA